MRYIFKGKNKFYLLVLILLIFLAPDYDSLGLSTEELSVSKVPLATEPPTVLAESTAMIPEMVKITRIIDGDTIELEDKQKVRLIGINTPETVDPKKGTECYGKEASIEAEKLMLNKYAVLEKDISEQDRYGRLLRYVWIDDRLINEELVSLGMATVSTYPPDVKYEDRFLTAQLKAREAQAGLWAGCGVN